MKDKDNSIQSQGGKARAHKLTAEERKSIASKAASTRWNQPKEVYPGTLDIGSWRMNCCNLDDGRRIIATQSLSMLLIEEETKSIDNTFWSKLTQMPLMRSTKVTTLGDTLRNPIRYISFTGETKYGYESHVLIDYCKFLLDARRIGAIKGEALLAYADTAERFLTSIAKVGLDALIDEATGYQSIRERDALEALLDKYLKKEYATWMKRFPDDYYKEIFRLMNWEWKGMKINRPTYVGKITKDIVYQRLAPGILKELEQRNPADKDGTRKTRHHQWLTTDVGHPALAQHLHTLIALMKVSASYMQFQRMLKKALPKKGEHIQEELFSEDILEEIEAFPNNS